MSEVAKRRQCALIAGMVFMLLGLVGSVFAQSTDLAADLERHPLEPVDTSSPQATLRSFLENIRAAADTVLDGGLPQWFEALRARAARTLPPSAGAEPLPSGDLDTLSEVRLLSQGRLLLQVLLRIELPPFETIPDVAAVEATGLDSWTIPETEITIARVKDGPRAGEFLFSPETIERLPEFWARVRHLPVRPEDRRVEQALTAFAASSTWPTIQAAVTALPAPLRRPLFGMAAWKWLGMVGVLAATVALLTFAARLGRRWDQRHERPIARLGLPLAYLAVLGALPALKRLMADGINLPVGYMLPSPPCGTWPSTGWSPLSPRF